MKKLISTICIIFILVLTAPVQTFAEQSEDVVNEPVAQVDCFGGKEQFGSFLRSFISFDQFGMFFRDIFMNACQYTAVKLVKDDLTDLRERIRDSYYRCDNHQASNLRLEYNRREAELFFLRNLVKTDGKTLVKVDLASLKEKMKKQFVSNRKYFLERPKEGAKKELFDDVWNDFISRYDQQYFIDCKGDIELIQNKINSLRDTIDGIVQEFAQDAAELQDMKERRGEAMGNKTSPEEALKLNAMNIFAHAINQVSPQKFGQDVIRELESNTITQLELTQRLAAEERRFQMDQQHAEKFAKYKIKYQMTSNPISNDYSERADMIVESLENANLEALDVSSCLGFVNGTQCSQ
ncbi:hypothetical protein HOG48_04135 [Candidatus Peregrinibacteria bacterium]|jgi:hypothetical protein|nr:hypothetical protein [Candidatus Peregrinibacteria bacterium]